MKTCNMMRLRNSTAHLLGINFLEITKYNEQSYFCKINKEITPPKKITKTTRDKILLPDIYAI